MGRRKQKPSALGRLFGWLLDGPQPGRKKAAGTGTTYQRRRKREVTAGVREQKVRERVAVGRARTEARNEREKLQRAKRADARRASSEARREREHERSVDLRGKRAEAAMDARHIKRALRDQERAMRGYLSAGLTRTEAEKLARRDLVQEEEGAYADSYNPRRKRRRRHRGPR